MKPSVDSRALLDFALRSTGRARLAMRGTSMLPLLHEPHVLEVRRPRRNLRVGDIVLFEWERRIVAHRIVELRQSTVVCAGDAHPDRMETLRETDVLGVVSGVREALEQGSRRVDGPSFAARGWLLARSRRWRAFCLDATPWARPRAHASLTALVGAIVRGDGERLSQLIRTIDRRRVAFVAHQHRCAPILRDALLRRTGDDVAIAFASAFNASRWATAVRTAKLREHLRTVMNVLGAEGFSPVLLKGAARLWCDDPEADLHDSVDLDVMLDRSDVPRAREALISAGYRERTVETGDFYDRHHHAPPLFPSGPGAGIELHHALAPRDTLTTDTSFRALEPHFVDVSCGETRARRLDRVGTALHLIVHGHERYCLRDLYLLARLLDAMPPDERIFLRSRLDGERLARVPMQAMAAAAASLAQIAWPADRTLARFCAWAEAREDLPGPLRRRTKCYDAWMAAGGSSFSHRLRRAFAASKLDYIDARPLKTMRAFGRRLVMLACAAAIAAYVPLMRRA